MPSLVKCPKNDISFAWKKNKSIVQLYIHNTWYLYIFVLIFFFRNQEISNLDQKTCHSRKKNTSNVFFFLFKLKTTGLVNAKTFLFDFHSFSFFFVLLFFISFHIFYHLFCGHKNEWKAMVVVIDCSSSLFFIYRFS